MVTGVPTGSPGRPSSSVVAVTRSRSSLVRLQQHRVPRLQRLGEVLDGQRAQPVRVVGDQRVGGEPREGGVAAQLTGDPLTVVDRLGRSVGQPDHEVEVVLVERRVDPRRAAP